jgi:hypothetical protein
MFEETGLAVFSNARFQNLFPSVNLPEAVLRMLDFVQRQPFGTAYLSFFFKHRR